MIIQADLKRKPSSEGESCAVAAWILKNTVRTAWKTTA